MAKPLDPPLRGRWPFRGYPDRIWVLGRPFDRAVFVEPRPGVVEEYREARDREAGHLRVLEGGGWIWDHLDEANPDRGRWLEHLLFDRLG